MPIIIIIAIMLLLITAIQRTSKLINEPTYDEDTLEVICVHEAAHAIIGYHFKDVCGPPIHVQVNTTSPRVTYSDEGLSITNDEAFEANIIRTLSGSVAERIILGKKTTGGLNDMQMVKSNYISKHKDNAFSDSIVIEEFLNEATKGRIHKAIELEFNDHLEQTEELVKKYQSEIKDLAKLLAKKEYSDLKGTKLDVILNNIMN